MKTPALLATLLALTGACSSSTSDRPTAQAERHAEIEKEQERAATETRTNTADESRADTAATAADDEPSTWAKADANRSARSANDDVEEADNTGRNERDDEPGKLTALDQSNSTSDVDITQAIRKRVIANDALSFNAKNVKIITVSGKVTLRGPVESAQESTSIEKSARAVAGVVAVDNQIEVKR